MKKQPTQNKGFTLIETLVYLALLGLVFTGLLTAGFAIVQSLDVLKTCAIVQEEGDFILAKLNWAVVGSDAVDTMTTNYLKMRRANPGPGMPSTVEIKTEADDLVLKKGTGDYEPLNASVVNISNINFTAPETDSIKTDFTVTAKTPTGREYTQDFR